MMYNIFAHHLKCRVLDLVPDLDDLPTSFMSLTITLVPVIALI
jgi:hypothetical protein